MEIVAGGQTRVLDTCLVRYRIENKDQNQTIRVQGRSATVTQLVTIKGSVNGQDISGPYQLTDAWVKHGSQWLAAARQQKKAPGP